MLYAGHREIPQMHALLIGMTECGKTSLAKIIASDAKSKGKLVAVLDPLIDDGWEADFQTQDSEEFLKWAKANRSAYLFVDEGSVSIGRYNKPMSWLATMSRHWGHTAFFISQGLTQLPPDVRNNCGQLFLFTSADTINKTAAEEFNEPDLRRADKLEKGHFFIVKRFGKISKGYVDFDKWKVYAAS